jgi:hypothetical protein
MAKNITLAGIPTGVTWTAASAADWISESPTSGSGNGTIAVSCTANTGAKRSGTVVVTTEDSFTVTVNVAQAAGYTMTASPVSLSFNKDGG